MEERLAVFCEPPAPTVRNGAGFLTFGVGVGNPVLAHPVIEAEVRAIAAGGGEADEELVGLQLVKQVEAALEGVLGATQSWPRVLVAPLR